MIKEIDFEATFHVRQEVMSPNIPLSKMKRPGDENASHYGYYNGNQLIGVISFYHEDEEGNEVIGVWRIRGMAVDLDFQRKGIGAKLVKHGLQILPIRRCWLNADLEAVKFYEKIGFKKIAIIEVEYGRRFRMEFFQEL